jgi:hypothetical protein
VQVQNNIIFTVYNDVHLGSTYAYDWCFPFEQDAILNGDIVDYQNCLKKDVPKYLELIKSLKDKFGDRYILGNHELRAIPCKGFYKHNSGVIFRHGDHEFWGEKKLDLYIKKATPGAGWLKRNLIARQIDWIRRIYTAKCSDEFFKRAADTARQHKCHTIVFGHKHPLNIVDKVYDGIRVIVLPRGRNIITA